MTRAVGGDHSLFQLDSINHLYQVLLLIEVCTFYLYAHVLLGRRIEDTGDVIHQTYDIDRGRAVVFNRYRRLDVGRHERLDPRLVVLFEQDCIQHSQLLLLQVNRTG